MGTTSRENENIPPILPAKVRELIFLKLILEHKMPSVYISMAHTVVQRNINEAKNIKPFTKCIY